MIRTALYLLISIFLITFLRYVIGIIGKAFSDLGRPSQSSANPSTPRSPAAAAELKRDPVCGTFVAASSSVKKSVRGEVVHFCSEACRDKYQQG